jgi:predicted DsbA family dithiol-disulfide isomerase
MKVEIWSDVICPFCYIGKRHIEKALGKLPFSSEVEIEWKSYQLNPDYHNTNNEDLYTYLARAKGMTVEQTEQMTIGVEQMAQNAGLQINFANNVPANSFNAHRLIHFAKQNQLQNHTEEALFKAHFINGKDIAKEEVLLAIADEIGLNTENAKAVLQGDEFTEAVKHDIYQAQQIGVRGVPYFVFDNKYALSGAQPVQVFEQALVQSFTEWQATEPKPQLTSLNKDNDAVCGEDGCEI